MVSIKWCLQQKDGLEFIEPNDNLSKSYLNMAEESINAIKGVGGSRIWTATMTYYIFYYSLYSLMLRIGIKCEIHSCSLEFMKNYLTQFYDKKDIEMIGKAFSARIDLQYYAGRPVDSEAIEETKKHSKLFFIKTKDAISKIAEDEIYNIRENLKKEASAK